MAWVPIALAAVAVVGAVAQARSARAAAKYNTAIAERNAVVSRQQAGVAETAQRQDSYRAMGRIRAGYSAAGVTPEGTPLDVLEDSAAEAELDALNIRYKGELSAIGYEGEAGLQRIRAKSALSTGVFNAGTALLAGAGGYYSNTYGQPTSTASESVTRPQE
jgi:hypothetical protein